MYKLTNGEIEHYTKRAYIKLVVMAYQSADDLSRQILTCGEMTHDFKVMS